MIFGSVFFYGVLFAGVSLLGAVVYSWVTHRRIGWRDESERASLRLALEFSLGVVAFALIPFLFHRIFQFETVAWQLCSLAIAMFLIVQIMRISYAAHVYGVRWPIVLISLLVLSGILLTIEVVNVFRWQSFAGYAGGLAWILILAGIQFAAYVYYVRFGASQFVFSSPETGFQDVELFAAGYHGILGERLRRDRRANHPDRSPYRYRHVHRDPVSYARRQRYAHRLANPYAYRAYRRAITNAAFWADEDG